MFSVNKIVNTEYGTELYINDQNNAHTHILLIHVSNSDAFGENKRRLVLKVCHKQQKHNDKKK